MERQILSRVAASSGILGVVVTLFVGVFAFAGVNPYSQGASSGSEDDQSVIRSSSLDALSDAADLTAAFNVGSRAVSSYPLHLPFQILYLQNDPTAVNNTGGTNTTFNVRRGTQLYVPILYNDNSLPIIGDFPPAGNRRALLHYIYSQEEFGLVYARIVVDGEVAALGPHFVVEVPFPSVLPDGATLYQTVAAFLAPLKRGTHSVEIAFLATGEAFSAPDIIPYFPGGIARFSTTYTVNVQ